MSFSPKWVSFFKIENNRVSGVGMSPWTDVEGVRLLTGITQAEVSDVDVSLLIDQADIIIKGELRADYSLPPRVIGEAVGTGDGVSVQFLLDNTPVVTGSCRIYLDGTEKVEPTDYSLDTSTGTIIFITAPASGLKITADYNYSEDAEVLTLASSYLAAYLCMVKTRGKLPIRYSMGRLRVVDPDTGSHFWLQYRKYLGILRQNEGISTLPTERAWSSIIDRKEYKGSGGL